MRAIHSLALAFLLSATPAAAQQVLDTDAPAPAAAAPAEVAAPQQAPLSAPKHDKRLDVDREQARATMSASDSRHAPAGIGNHQWWWVVTAIAVGVIIAAVVL